MLFLLTYFNSKLESRTSNQTLLLYACLKYTTNYTLWIHIMFNYTPFMLRMKQLRMQGVHPSSPRKEIYSNDRIQFWPDDYRERRNEEGEVTREAWSSLPVLQWRTWGEGRPWRSPIAGRSRRGRSGRQWRSRRQQTRWWRRGSGGWPTTVTWGRSILRSISKVLY